MNQHRKDWQIRVHPGAGSRPWAGPSPTCPAPSRRPCSRGLPTSRAPFPTRGPRPWQAGPCWERRSRPGNHYRVKPQFKRLIIVLLVIFMSLRLPEVSLIRSYVLWPFVKRPREARSECRGALLSVSCAPAAGLSPSDVRGPLPPAASKLDNS